MKLEVKHMGEIHYQYVAIKAGISGYIVEEHMDNIEILYENMLCLKRHTHVIKR